MILRASLLVAAALITCFLATCETARQPPPYEIFELRGTAYERGFHHGEHFASKIRSFYTQMLTTSLLPFLDRLRPDIESVLWEYRKDAYDDGRFAYEVMRQSAWNLAPYIPEPFLEEMRGVADGAELPFEQILILNTFVDTMLGLRSISFFLHQSQAPRLLSVEFQGGLASDGMDNDGDGDIDESDEGLLDPYAPTPYASMVEVPVGAKIRMVLEDGDGVDPRSIRIQLDDRVYEAGDESVETATVEGNDKGLEVVFTPPGGLTAADTVSLLLQAGDLSLVVDPPPSHARFMRDERIVFTTAGLGKAPHQVENRGERDERAQPPSIAFALRGAATADGRPLVAQHFALLDNNTAHKHAVLFVHHPKEGKPHAMLGWSGAVGGLAGMNGDGLVWVANMSDTLNNSIAGEVLEKFFGAKLLASGVPVVTMGREVLTRFSETNEAAAHLEEVDSAFGWNVLLADRTGKMAAAELDSNIMDREDGGCHAYTPDPGDTGNLDPWDRPWASVGPDDLRIASHYQRNADDIDHEILGFHVRPQRYWSSYYFKSLRAFYILGEQISGAYGELDAPVVMNILGMPDLVNQRDSMNAVVFEPRDLKLHFAMGQVPATSGSFREFDLGAALAGGGRL